MHRQDMPRYVDCVVLCDVIMPCFDMSCRGSVKIQVCGAGCIVSSVLHGYKSPRILQGRAHNAVCACVCQPFCLRVCPLYVYVCLHVHMNVFCMSVCLSLCLSVWMCVRMYLCMYEWLCVCVCSVCLYVRFVML